MTLKWEDDKGSMSLAIDGVECYIVKMADNQWNPYREKSRVRADNGGWWHFNTPEEAESALLENCKEEDVALLEGKRWFTGARLLNHPCDGSKCEFADFYVSISTNVDGTFSWECSMKPHPLYPSRIAPFTRNVSTSETGAKAAALRAYMRIR